MTGPEHCKRPDGWSRRDAVIGSLAVLVQYQFASPPAQAEMHVQVRMAREKLSAELGITGNTTPGQIAGLLREAL